MKKEEAAKHIVDKFMEYAYEYEIVNGPADIQEWNATKCAIICVNYLIAYLPSENGNPPGMQRSEYDSEYWQEVKAEVLKMLDEAAKKYD